MDNETTLRAQVRKMMGKLPRSWWYEAFYQSARSLGVIAYQVEGTQGTFVGPLFDQSVIKPYMMEKHWSKDILELLVGFFGDQGGTFYDLGANIGLLSVPMSKRPNMRVVAFEPDAQNYSLLCANVAANGASVETLNVAVGD